MHLWANDLFADPSGIGSRFYQAFAAGFYCRTLQTIATGRIESKPSAARWALANLDSRWHGLIRASLAERGEGSERVRQASDPGLVAGTLEFIRMALALGGA